LYDGANQVHLDHLASIFSQIHEQKKREMNNKYIDCLHMVACPHQIILGYMFVLYPESVRDTIVYLATRYQRRPPKKVLYDNSCHAEKSGKLVSTLTAFAHHAIATFAPLAMVML
jgi:predicted aldo/keto reductase-like oxidoreductase